MMRQWFNENMMFIDWGKRWKGVYLHCVHPTYCVRVFWDGYTGKDGKCDGFSIDWQTKAGARTRVFRSGRIAFPWNRPRPLCDLPSESDFQPEGEIGDMEATFEMSEREF
jgi:hypothetical protein